MFIHSGPSQCNLVCVEIVCSHVVIPSDLSDCVILVTVKVSTLNGCNARLVSRACPYLFQKWCSLLTRGRFTCSNMIYCVIRVHDVSSTAVFWRRGLNVITVCFWAHINICSGQKVAPAFLTDVKYLYVYELCLLSYILHIFIF